MKSMALRGIAASAAALFCGIAAAPAQAQSDEELAKKAMNPVAAMVSLPMKYDYDADIGPKEQGRKDVFTIQPVVPFSIGTGWNLISRTIIPLVRQRDVAPGSGTQSGLADITQQFYFSPKEPLAGGWIVGFGPQMALRTGADGLTADKWGLGPAMVALKQENGWTYGALLTHMWDVAGSDTAAHVNNTFIQPFAGYTTAKFTTYQVNTESTYNWTNSKWSVPVNLTISQMLKIGSQPMTILGGARYWATSPDGVGPRGWGFRFQVTLLFPAG